MSEVFVHSKPSKRIMKENKIKRVRPSTNGDYVMSSIVDKKTFTKRNYVKKKHIQKYDYDLEANENCISYNNCRGWI